MATAFVLPKLHARSDWSRRPLSDAELAYAADDVRHLAALHDRLTADLQRQGRLAWAASEHAALADPAQDFAKLPLPFLLPALGGYLGTMGASPSGLRLWQARTFRYHLEWGIAAANQRDSEGHPLGGATHERLAGVLRFLSMTADPRWSWLGRF